MKTYSVTFVSPSGISKTIAIPADQPILKPARKGGVKMAASCNTGACGECVVRYLGEDMQECIDTHENSIVNEQELAMGFFPACCCFLLTDGCVIKTSQEKEWYDSMESQEK